VVATVSVALKFAGDPPAATDLVALKFAGDTPAATDSAWQARLRYRFGQESF